MKRICKKVRKNLPAFINNKLDKEKVKTIEQHFNICPICRKEAEDIRSQQTDTTGSLFG